MRRRNQCLPAEWEAAATAKVATKGRLVDSGSYAWREADGVSWGGTGMAETVKGEFDAEQVETAARAALSGIQDFTAEHLALPWPAEADGSMADADVRVDAGRIHLWFGRSEESAVLTLRPIELNEIAQP